MILCAILLCVILQSLIVSPYALNQAEQLVLNHDTSASFKNRTDALAQPDSPWHLARLAQKKRLSEAAIFRDGGLDWDLNSIVRLVSFDWEFPRDDRWGEDVFVYVLDSGVRGSHVEFRRGQVLEGAATGTGRDGDGMRDQQSHGTGVASLVAGKKVGVAKSATIIPVKIAVDGSPGEVPTTASDVAAGLKWACEDWKKRSQENSRYRAVINISWITRDRPETVKWLRMAIEELHMHVVIAAGNGGTNECQTDPNSPTEDKWIRPLGQIGVGAIDHNDWFYENHGSCVDVVAPSYYLKHADSDNDEEYKVKGKTSEAAPLVTGVIAALITHGEPGHSMSPIELRDMLLDRYTHPGIQYLPLGTPDRIINSEYLVAVPQ